MGTQSLADPRRETVSGPSLIANDTDMFTFATDYYLLVFAASIGVIQIAASMGRLYGLLIFKSLLVARTFGLILIVASFVWFFGTESRNLNDKNGGLDANSQTLFFFLGASTGLVVTFLVSSLVNIRMNGTEPPPEGGLDALREANYVRALGLSVRYWWRNWRTQMKRYFFG